MKTQVLNPLVTALCLAGLASVPPLAQARSDTPRRSSGSLTGTGRRYRRTRGLPALH